MQIHYICILTINQTHHFMKTFLSITTVLLFAIQVSLSAQINEKEVNMEALKTDTASGWKSGGTVSVSFSQTSLTNWSAGGENSLSLNTILSLYARHATPNSEWLNTLDFGYGFLNQSIKGFTKTDDRFEIISKYGRKAFDKVYYSVLAGFRTQFFEGYDYKPTPALKISDLLSPGYGTLALGMNYKPNNYFNAFVSPVTSRTTFVMNDSLSGAGAFGVEKGKHVKEELGGYIRLFFSKNDFKNEFLKNVTLTSKLDLFSNYLSHPERIDVIWDNLITMKVNKLLNVSLVTSMIYDYDTKINGKDRLQFKEIFGFGISYNFKK